MLLLHINFYMFLPQCPEQDVYDANGRQTDDINSLVEDIRVELGYDKTVDDEDDDNGNNFLSVKNCDLIYSPQTVEVIIQPRLVIVKKKTSFPLFDEHICTDTVNEVATPPPDPGC